MSFASLGFGRFFTVIDYGTFPCSGSVTKTWDGEFHEYQFTVEKPTVVRIHTCDSDVDTAVYLVSGDLNQGNSMDCSEVNCAATDDYIALMSYFIGSDPVYA
eukprot:308074_1